MKGGGYFETLETRSSEIGLYTGVVIIVFGILLTGRLDTTAIDPNICPVWKGRCYGPTRAYSC